MPNCLVVAVLAWSSLDDVSRAATVSLVHRSGVLVRGALDDTGQCLLYGGLCSAARGTVEERRLAGDEAHAPDRPWPLCVWRHPYTWETNSKKNPAPLFAWARRLAREAASEVSDPDARARLEAARFDSLLSLLYAPGGSLGEHVDHGLQGFGLAVSLGSSCVFDYGSARFELRSGDALFADFGHVVHSVVTTHAPDTAPRWWRDLPRYPRSESPGASFDRVRCGVQLREASRPAWRSCLDTPA